jgi:hypothetical protein
MTALIAPSDASMDGQAGSQGPLLTGVNGMRGVLACSRVGVERVSRRVGELVLERTGGQGSSWST